MIHPRNVCLVMNSNLSTKVGLNIAMLMNTCLHSHAPLTKETSVYTLDSNYDSCVVKVSTPPILSYGTYRFSHQLHRRHRHWQVVVDRMSLSTQVLCSALNEDEHVCTLYMCALKVPHRSIHITTFIK